MQDAGVWTPSEERAAIADLMAFLESQCRCSCGAEEQVGGWPGKEKWDTGLLLGLRAKSLLSRLEHKIKNAYERVSCP